MSRAQYPEATMALSAADIFDYSAAKVPITSAVVRVTSSRTSSRTSDEVTARVASNSRASLRSCSSWAAEASAPAPARAGGGSAARSSRENRRWADSGKVASRRGRDGDSDGEVLTRERRYSEG